MTGPALHLFEGVGIELEYMIVDRESLAVRPIADELMRLESGTDDAEFERGAISWSNELVLHVLELKTNGPARDLRGLAVAFQAEVDRANAHLAGLGAQLLPGGMHPFMDPATETELWPHEYNEVYRTFDRIFGCGSHGWANVQSTHINLPFANDEEFGRLHAAVRAVVPIIPALSASSPFRDGARAGALDGRVAAYRTNAARVPSVTGSVVPEPMRSHDQYAREILERIYRDLADLDPDGVLRHEWVNARGAIARFGRGTIEIRLIDAQESPRADLAVAAAVLAAVRWLTENPPAGAEAANAVSTASLTAVLDATVNEGSDAIVTGRDYLRVFGLDRTEASVMELWAHIVEASLPELEGWPEWSEALDVILERACLAQRLVRSIGAAAERDSLLTEYRRLARCLSEGSMYDDRDARSRRG